MQKNTEKETMLTKGSLFVASILLSQQSQAQQIGGPICDIIPSLCWRNTDSPPNTEAYG